MEVDPRKTKDKGPAAGTSSEGSCAVFSSVTALCSMDGSTMDRTRRKTCVPSLFVDGYLQLSKLGSHRAP